MKVAIIGSRGLNIEIPDYCIPENTTQIVSGGAIGIDRKAREFAYRKGIRILEIVPDYDLYGRRAPLKRNDVIIEYSDMVVAFWDGKSGGTGYVVNRCRKTGKRVVVYLVDKDGNIKEAPEQLLFEF